MKLYLILILFTISIYTFSQESAFNPVSLNTEIKGRVEESKIENELKNKEVASTGLQNNLQLITRKYKNAYIKVKQRVNKLSIVVDAAKLGLEAVNKINNIKLYTRQLINEIIDYPYISSEIINETNYIINKSESITRYLYAVIATSGVIIEMENADRVYISKYIINELSDIEYHLRMMLTTVRNAKLKHQLLNYTFQYYNNKDKKLIEEIIRNAKDL